MEDNSTKTLKEQIYDALVSDIIKGVYPLDTILTEKFLMEKYNVSRAPIREALTQLTATLILTSIPRQGYKICQPTMEEVSELVRFRSVLECSFLQNYSFCIDENWIKELRTICYNFTNSHENDSMARWNYNCQFHLRLFSVYGNNYAYKQLEDALNIQTIYFIHIKQYATMDLHLALIDYLEKGDITTAVSILKADIENLLVSSITPAPTVYNN